jgi:hypothetical protein
MLVLVTCNLTIVFRLTLTHPLSKNLSYFYTQIDISLLRPERYRGPIPLVLDFCTQELGALSTQKVLKELLGVPNSFWVSPFEH